MGTVSVEILIVVVLVLINGLLAMSELAIVSARRIRLQQRASAGSSGARTALELAGEPTRFLSTVQIGITLVGILAGAFGGATLSKAVASAVEDVPGIGGYSDAIGIGVVVLAITYLSLVVGELVPKRIALQNAEGIAMRVARPMQVIATVTSPVVSLLSASTDILLRVLGARASADPAVTEEEIHLLIEQGAQAGVIEESEQELVHSVFRLGDRQVGELMTPRHRLVYLDLEDPPGENRRRMAESGFSHFPVTQGGLDRVVGMLSVRALWARAALGAEPEVRDVMIDAIYIPETTTALLAVEAFKQIGRHQALVVDEYGVVQGMVTLTDIVEAIVGDVEPAPAGSPAAVQREDGSWLLDGALDIDDVRRLLDVGPLPGEGEGDFRTLGGFLMARLGRVPRVADELVWDDLCFEVVDMDGNRVDKVLVRAAR
jgi:putative hemolysin